MKKSSRAANKKTKKKTKKKPTATTTGAKAASKASKKSSRKKAPRKRPTKAASGASIEPLPLAEILKAVGDAQKRVVQLPKWEAAFANALPRAPLLVRGQPSPATDYYIVDFRKGPNTTSLMLVNAATGIIDQIAGVQKATDDALMRFFRPEEIPDYLNGRTEVFNDSRRVLISGSHVRVKRELFWTPCDQSVTPFMPLYVAEHLKDGVSDVLWIRVDGEVYTAITQNGRGL